MNNEYYDQVFNPKHYNKADIECIDAIEAATLSKRGIEAVCVANVIKYLWRYEDKGGLRDVKKAQFYLEKLIDKYEQEDDGDEEKLINEYKQEDNGGKNFFTDKLSGEYCFIEENDRGEHFYFDKNNKIQRYDIKRINK